MAHATPEVLPLEGVEVEHIMPHQAKSHVRAEETNTSLDQNWAGIENTQARSKGTIHPEPELVDGLQGNIPSIKPSKH